MIYDFSSDVFVLEKSGNAFFLSLRNASCCVLVLYIELYFPVKHNNIPINSLTYHCA
jgi:hypothetical protein